ncbi:MAG: substrate-binding domain-containing protein [Vibrionaceae bacterium]
MHSLKYIVCTLLLSLPLSLSAAQSVNLYGPGGPHVALQKVGEDFHAQTGIKVNVTFGPQASWNEKAKHNADILFGTSEQSALAIIADHSAQFDAAKIMPIYLRPAIILVKKGNPKKIKGLMDLTRPGIGIVVPEGSGKSNTSGTGVWEDMIGRSGNIEQIAKFRKNIVSFTPNSGSARKAFLENPQVDAWITWLDWAKTNPDFGDVVAIEKELVIYRDINVALKKMPSKQSVQFANYLTSDKAKTIFAQYGFTQTAR